MSIRTYQNHTPRLGQRVFVDPSAVLIGDIEIGEDSSVWPLTVIRGDMHRIRIGARTSVQLALIDNDGPTGGYYYFDQVLPW